MGRIKIYLNETDFNLVVFLAFILDLISYHEFAYFYRYHPVYENNTDLVSEFPILIGLDCYEDLTIFCMKNKVWIAERFSEFQPNMLSIPKLTTSSKWLMDYKDSVIKSWLDDIKEIDLIIKYIVLRDNEEDI